MAKDISKRGIADLGEEFWNRHMDTIDKFWNSISDYFSSIDVAEMKLYQDGMVADGDIAKKIVEDGISSGSKNYQLDADLIKRGAILVRTEDFKLLKKELESMRTITRAKTIIQKIAGFIRYKLIKNRLLAERDKFIAKRIDETLGHGEKGILFLGAYHNIKKYLPENIQIKEIKDVDKIREYHKLIPFYRSRNKQRFKELSEYLIRPCKGDDTGKKKERENE
ncbi:MAG: hypothetical protein ABIH89_02750 [Elusimicrobiota bacterium]